MSANNQILIEKVRGKWRATDEDVDCGGGHFMHGRILCRGSRAAVPPTISDEPFETLEGAIKAANDYQDGGGVEYGLKIVLPRQKLRAKVLGH